MKFRKQSHCLYFCDYHVVICSKYRRKIFDDGVFEYIKSKFLEIEKYYPEIEIKISNHDEDHVHMIIGIPPKMAVSEVIRLIKTNSARGIKEKFAFLKKVYWGKDGIWSDGYFVSTVGVNEEIVQKYIEHQGKTDSAQAKLEW